MPYDQYEYDDGSIHQQGAGAYRIQYTYLQPYLQYTVDSCTYTVRTYTGLLLQ
jgi:hypothetical protein